MIPDLWHDVMSTANDRPGHGQVIRKDSRRREVVPLYNCQRKEWAFIVLLMYGSVWSGMGAYSRSFWPVSEYMVVKKSQPDRVLFYRTLGDVREHFSVQRTSTPVCWSSGSHCYMMSSRLWPSVLPYVGQLRFYLCWSGYECSIQGRHTIPGALLLCWKMLDVCLYVWFEYFFVRSPRSDLLLWSHFVYVGSNSGRDRFPVQGTLHGLLPPELGHVEHTGFGGVSRPDNLAFTRVKMHFPCLLRLFKFLKVLLQGLGIIFTGDGQIYGSVISKKADLWLYVFRQVIYVQDEQDWSKDRTLGHPQSDRDLRWFPPF